MGSIPESAPPRVRVFIAGGSYAGLSTALNLLDLGEGLSPRMGREPYEHHPDVPRLDLQITIADERDGFCVFLPPMPHSFVLILLTYTNPPLTVHLIGAPLALADADYCKKAWVKFGDVTALHELPGKVKVLQGSVTSVDPASRTATVVDHATGLAATHEYDYFVAATGLRRVWPVVPQALGRKQYLIEAGEHIHTVANARDGVVVVGGGAVGIEMAAELKMVKPHVKVTLVHSREQLLSSEGLPDETRDRALELLKEAGVECLMGHRLASSDKVETADGAPRYEVKFTNGKTIVASQVIMAISKSTPTTAYLPKSTLNEEGYVKILPK